MMDTILNLGLNEEVVETTCCSIRQSALGMDCYRRLSRCIPTLLWKSARK